MPKELAPDVYWVGCTLEHDAFQLHAYLLRCGNQSVLIDPGSPVTIEQTLAKVRQVMDPEDIGWIICHHADPDVAAALHPLSHMLKRDDVHVVTEWRGDALLRHYGHRFTPYYVEQHDWRLPLADDRVLEFQLTPYLHFPGAFVTHDPKSRTLFSSDIFGGFVDDPEILVSDDPASVIRAVRPFHQHYMPTGALLRASLQRVKQRWPDIARVAPQHGYVFEGDAVEPTFSALEQIECGLFVQESADHDLQRFLQMAEARSDLQRSLLQSASVTSWLAALNGIIARTGLAQGCDIIVFLPNVGWRRWGVSASAVPANSPTGAHIVMLEGQPRAAVELLGVRSTENISDLQALIAEFDDLIRPLVDALIVQQQHSEDLHLLRAVSLTDPLTGCANRRALDEHPPMDGYGLLALDIDHFKNVNDTLGHQAGDALIVAVANAIQTVIRHTDTLYRIGGDEFIVLLPSTDLERTEDIARRCVETVAALPAGTSLRSVTISVGATAVLQHRMDTLQQAIATADAALYTAKRGGRNRFASMSQPDSRPH